MPDTHYTYHVFLNGKVVAVSTV